MRTFLQKPRTTPTTTSVKSSIVSRTVQQLRGNIEKQDDSKPYNISDSFSYDFSGIPVFPRQVSQGRQVLRASGEMAESSLNEGEEWLPATGDGGSPTDAGVPAGVPAGPAAASTPRLRKTTVSALSTRNNGGFNWGVRWSIDNASTSTSGWIVQHVVVKQNVEAWYPPLRPGNTLPIVPGEGGYGGLREAWYPLWEAWQVRGGQVFVGRSTSAHNADTYGQSPVGADTKGKTEVVGRADFYPNLTLPTSFTVRNAAPAWSLPVTNADPSLTGGTGVLNHDLTATWDGVGGTGTTTATTV